MEKEIEELRRAIRKTPRNARGRRRYGKELRARITECAGRWRSGGHKLAALAAELGVSDSMLSEWTRKAEPRAVRPVEVVDEGPARSGAVLRLPSGITIEGLSMADLVEFVRRVS